MRKMYLVPNIFTAFSLSCGLFVIFKMNLTEQGVGIYQVLQTATILLLLASVADWIDGALARAIHAETSFGFIFDSMADGITFGVAPSVIVLKTLSLPLWNPYSIFGVIGAMLFSICGILRLVRFNVKESAPKPKKKKERHFTGLPIPSAALAVVGTNFLFVSPRFQEWLQLDEVAQSVAMSCILVVLSYFMVSRFKFPSAKMLYFRAPSFPLVFLIVLFALFVLYGVLYFLPFTLAIVAWVYILLGWVFAIIRAIAGKNPKLSLILNRTTTHDVCDVRPHRSSFVALVWQHFATKARFAEEKYALAEKVRGELEETFKALSHDALERNSRSFLDLAKTSMEKYQESAEGELKKREEAIKHLVTPVTESLAKLQQGLHELEKERKGDYASLKAQVGLLRESESDLKKETSNLVKALRTPHIRGQWGEVQLRRVVELAGMVKYCDFVEQESEGSRLRPDLIVRLAGGRQVIIDSKVPLEPYLDAMQAEREEDRAARLANYARGVRTHILQLSRKAYHEHFTPTPEFVILFLPSEHFFSAALQQDASLIEMGAEKGIILATPTTLIALLRSVAYGWKQENLSRHAQKVSELGSELYKRLIDMSGHFTKMGRSLSSAVEAYNKGVGSLESRVLVTGRKFQELGAASTQLDVEEIPLVEKTPRSLQE